MAAPNKILCCVVALVLGIGIYDVFTNFEKNRCAMSFMWEIPQYIAVPGLDETIQQRYPYYSLTLYGEGKYAQDIRNMKLSGIPVLFIPGNAGSHKQVRSLSSIALRKAAMYNFHFNYFSVDLNEELNGLYGGVLEGQTEYVFECVNHILSLYKKNKKNPQQVVIIAHSKGGLIAKALFARPDFDSSTINTLITMGTPHLTSVIKPDVYMDQFTSRVNQFWSDNWNSSRLQDVTVLSVGGGYRDTMVRSGLVSMDGMVAPDNGLSVVAGSVPKVWLSTDHRCIVWCKELVLATNRALFDMVDKLTKQISINPVYRMHVLRHHFVAHNGQPSYKPDHSEDVVAFVDAQFKTIDTGFHHIAGQHNKQTVHYVFPLKPDDPDQDSFTITTTIITSKGWLFICTRSHEERCIEGVDVTGRAQLMPPLKSDSRVAHLDLKNLGVANPKQIVMRVPLSNKIHVVADIYKNSERTFNASVPGFFSYKAKTIMKQDDSHSLFFNISLPDLNAVWKAYTVTLEPVHCFEPVRRDGNTTLHLHVPWYQEDEWSVAKATENNVLSVKLQSGRPEGDDRPVQLHVYVYSRCHYQLKVGISHTEVMGQLVRFYGYLLPCFVSDVAMLVTAYMFFNVATNKPVLSFILTQSTHCKPFVVVPFVSLIRGLLPYVHKPLFNANDFRVLDQQNINFAVLPILLFLLGYGVLCIMAAIMECDVLFFGKVLSLFKGTSISVDTHSGSLGYTMVLYALLGVLMAMCLGSCGAVVLLILTVLYLLKVIALQAQVNILKGCLNIKPVKETVAAKPEEDGKETKTDTTSQENDATVANAEETPPSPLDLANTSLHFHFAMMMLMLLLTLLNIPSLAVWIMSMRNEVYSLEMDPARYTTLVVIVALTVLLDPAYTQPKKGVITKAISWIIHAFTIAAVLFGMDAMYRLSYFMATTLLLAAINQRVSTMM